MPAAEKPFPAKPAIAGGAILFALTAGLIGGWVVLLVVGVAVLAMLQGLWRGATELVGLVVGMLLAAVLARPIGAALDGIPAAIFGTTGLTNRLLSIAVTGLVIVSVCGVGLSIVAKRQMKKHPAWRAFDPYVGAALGLAEGSLLAMFLLWTPLALEPIAAARLESDRAAAIGDGESPEAYENPVARAVLSLSGRVRDSGIGGFAEETNPFSNSRWLTLASDFAAVCRDPAAYGRLMNSHAMQRLRNLPSITAAMNEVQQDGELTELFKTRGVSTGTIRAVMDSPTILHVLDTTTAASDLAPLADDLIAAIREAKTYIGREPPG